jgi:hypothetical protein
VSWADEGRRRKDNDESAGEFARTADCSRTWCSEEGIAGLTGEQGGQGKARRRHRTGGRTACGKAPGAAFTRTPGYPEQVDGIGSRSTASTASGMRRG